MKGEVPECKKFEEFWAGILEDDTQTPYRKWMKTVAKKIAEKVMDVHALVTDEKKLCEMVRKERIGLPLGLMVYKTFGGKA